MFKKIYILIGVILNYLKEIILNYIKLYREKGEGIELLINKGFVYKGNKDGGILFET